MKIEIKHKISGKALFKCEALNIGVSVELAVKAKADLREANLRGADLRGANLSSADLDFSAWPLWCGSKNAKVSAKLAMQLAAHFCVLDCEDKTFIKAKRAILFFAKKSHRADDLGVK